METILDRYCYDLPTQPIGEHKILVTGASGYIGGELFPELISRGYKVRVMVRSFLPEYKERWPNVEIVVADILDYTQLENALQGIHSAYYLIHSLYIGPNFQDIDSQAALNFQKAAEKNNLKRIIYLGSLGNPNAILSGHLRSRIKVAEILQKGSVPVTFLRAAIIIGSGSASFKIIHNLIEKCPLFILPSWANSKCQPIAIRDTIKYLVGCLEKEETKGKTYDIGCEDILTYGMMFKVMAKVIHKKSVFIKSGIKSINFYNRIISVMTQLSPVLIKNLMESCINDVVCNNSDIKNLIPFETIGYADAIERALTRDSQKVIFKKAQAEASLLDDKRMHTPALKPPHRSKGILSDIRYFLLHKPDIPTLINFDKIGERENFSYRILQRLGMKVSNYRILNIHKIGVNAPANYIFEELLKWNGESTCWPNHIAKIVKKNNKLENLYVYLFGWTKFPLWIKNSRVGRSFIPLFKLDAIDFKKTPDYASSDNARYLLYKVVVATQLVFFQCMYDLPLPIFRKWINLNYF